MKLANQPRAAYGPVVSQQEHTPMSDEKNHKQPPLKPPGHRGKAVMLGPGQRRLEWDVSLIPSLLGETIRIGFRGDAQIVDAINEHLDRLESLAPGLVISASDGIRSLLHRGAQAFREDEINREEGDK